MATITFEQVEKKVGKEKADAVWHEITMTIGAGSGAALKDHDGGVSYGSTHAEAVNRLLGNTEKKEGK